MMRYGRLGALVLALVFLLPAGAAAQKQVDWPQFQFDAGKTGYNSFEKVINKDNVADLTEAWGYNLDGESGSSFSSPVAQGKIYVSFDTELGGLLYALDAFTGETVWPLEDPLPGNIGYIRSAPAVGKGVVYAVNHLGDLYALDADSGQTLWSCSIDDRQFYEDRPSSPTVAGNRVYVSSEDGTLFAFHGKSGRLLWDYQVYSGYLGSCSSPAVAGGLVYVCSDYELHAVKAATGAPKWTFASPAWLSFPVVAQGKVFVGGGRLVALNARTGQELWTYSPGGGSDFRISRRGQGGGLCHRH